MHTLFTIGHSTRTCEEFISLLKKYHIHTLVDVRRIPQSRFISQFSKEGLSTRLRNAGISYIHMEGVAGMREPHENSINKALKNPGFRGYADYMQTDAFNRSLDELLRISQTQQTTIMCAEARPWKCHRVLLSDTIIAQNISVFHIISSHETREHQLTPFAVRLGPTITYPTSQLELNL